MNMWDELSKKVAEINAMYNIEYCGQVLTLEDQMDMAMAYNNEADMDRCYRLMAERDMQIKAIFA